MLDAKDHLFHLDDVGCIAGNRCADMAPARPVSDDMAMRMADNAYPAIVPGEVGVFGVDHIEQLALFFRANGFATLRGLWAEVELSALDAACARAQQRVMAGALPARYGTLDLVDDESGERTARLANYVTHVTEIEPDVRAAVHHQAIAELVPLLLGGAGWLLECLPNEPFGVVFQDARPGKASGYTRIGWHSDWQSGPHLDRWPSVAFTLHLDATSPANGFLRVVPGSHQWATPAPFRNANGVVVPEHAKAAGGHTDMAPPMPMPLGFEKVPGEIGVYCERGDLLFHDAYLWHSAARATQDGAIRRHIRGGWYSGSPDPAVSIADFVKNAAR
jgi:hypothetical protein